MRNALIVLSILIVCAGAAGGDVAATQSSAATQPAIGPLEIRLVFPGSAMQGTDEAIVQPPEGCDLLTLHAADGTKIAALFGNAPNLQAPATKPALLFFYGNGMCMAHGLDLFNRFRSLGFNVIMADYEGYGMSGGTPSEAGCYAAADAAYDYLLTRKEVDQTRIVSVGWSLGAAVAIDLASRKPVAGLVTFSAFTNMTDRNLIRQHDFPLAIFFVSRFDNLAKIATVPCPILMGHGSRDPLIPVEMLDRLAAAAGSKATKFRVPGAQHNDIFQLGGDALFDRVKVFVNQLAPVNPTTQATPLH